MKSNRILLALVLSFSVFQFACNHSVSPDSPNARFGLRIWTAERCPSIALPPQPEIAALFTPLAAVFLGTLIQTGVNSISNALTEAAKADKEGTSIKGAKAGYLYVGRNTETAKMQAAAARCLILALSDVYEPVEYCNASEPLPDPLYKACKNGRDVLAHLNCDYVSGADPDNGPKCTPPTLASSDFPQIYAEISLVRATDDTGVKPSLVNLYYEAPLDPGRSAPERDLAISVQISALDGKTVANALLTKKNLIPTSDVKHTYDLTDSDGLWTIIPAYTGRTLVEKDTGLKIGAVNLSAEIRETGKINKFLQAFAKAFEKDTAKYQEAIADAVLPSKRQAAEVKALKGQAAVDKAKAAAQKAIVDFFNACKKSDYASPEAKAADLERLKAMMSSTYVSLRATEIENGASASISPAPSDCP